MEDLEYLPKPFSAAELVAKVREVCLAEPAAVKAPAIALGNGHKTRTSVLVVDSDPDFQAWIEIGLHHRQIDCFCVSDVNEGVGVAAASRPDVILLGVDGTTVVEDSLARLREAQATREVPVYVLTGLPTEYYDTLDVAGALRKPFSLSEIVELVLDPKVHSK
jgi:DNA-binding response OmpR family regulator